MSNNPYETPEADVAQPAQEGDFNLHEPVSVDAGRGWGWIADGFGFFKKNPGAWILTTIVWFIVIIAVNLLPIIGMIFFSLTFYVFIAGLMIGCRAQDEGKPFEVSHLFAGFKKNAGRIVLMSLAVNIISMLVMILTMGTAYFNLMMGDEAATQAMASDLTGFWLSFLIAMALMLPLFMAVWFAPVLIVLHDAPLVEAMKMSFFGCLKNILPFLIFGIISLVFYIIALIPIALGLLVFVPTMFAAMYVAYKDIYIDFRA
ncbi:hypothetical protein FLL45_08640 [Aliikangiella marina]|uniref:DUF2189 domain-containing protein n=1 Tax=Aliikangiella marina TaxID=1712262 RepID=A0A545TCR3_9GAMM|nr:BPSS1780 family membrane protein [Aliikangiella marina]TQV74999.1 hypothetical protein FLL45_08640 [Aliikangiella marina]